MIAECLLPEPELNLYGTTTTTSVEVSRNAGTGMVTVDNRFATMPSLAAVSVPASVPTYRPFDEEELHTSFEQAISERVIAVKRMLHMHTHAHVVSGLLEQQTVPLALVAPSVDARQTKRTERLPRKSTALLHTNPVMRGLTYTGLALIFALLGFDVMGILALFAR